MSEGRLKEAYRLHQAGRLAEAAQLYETVLRAEPSHFEATYRFALTWLQRGDFPRAEASLERALAIDPQSSDARFHYACALQQQDRHADALPHFDHSLSARPDRFIGWNNRGNTLLLLGRQADAVASYERALTLKPDYAEGWHNRGVALAELQHAGEALQSFDRALALNPHYEAALECRGNLYSALHDYEQALADFDRLKALRPAEAALLYNRANALTNLKRFDEAIADARAVLALDPAYPYAQGVLLHSKLHACDWHEWEDMKVDIARGLEAGARTVSPFDHKAISSSPEDELRCARAWMADQSPQQTPLWTGEHYGHDRIRIAYVSAEFRAHPVAQLMAGIFEQHDRSRFETFAVSFGPEQPGSSIRARLEDAFDRFLSVPDKSDTEIATLLRKHEIDIAVDLMGLTGECRPRIFAQRAAPVQVNYLGFPGTTGAPYMEYLIADSTIIPPSQHGFYDEKIVTMPGCFMPADDTRHVAERSQSRAEAGLPEQAFVFCSFNNSYKFSPAVFDIWMQLLHRVEDSVLWLPQANTYAMRNLKHEAETRGVAAARLIFAPYVEAWEDHLARLTLADLFLDTLPYGAHSTASDALWVGLPVLTCLGTGFAGRVAASLLSTIGLSELIASSPTDYESKALALARDPHMLRSLRERLAENRTRTPLFDTARFTRTLEAAFTRMWQRAEAGDAPESFVV